VEFLSVEAAEAFTASAAPIRELASLNHTDTSRHRHNDRGGQSNTTAAFARTPFRS
jgi:hypothetical protein